MLVDLYYTDVGNSSTHLGSLLSVLAYGIYKDSTCSNYLRGEEGIVGTYSL
jgi:hypothetical protein